ncbi:MAG: tetratricopeptide repeat protein [Armatimonadetes bacterium]|nr:tetratricopeptide repeat protein [Armatimonadota bacterium]
MHQDREVDLAIAFTDVVGSTRLWERFPAELPQVMARHQGVLSAAAEQHGGQVIKWLGDGAMAVFEEAAQAAHWAVASQAETSRDCLLPSGQSLAMRVGLHYGPATPVVSGGEVVDYFGIHVNRAARICQLCQGGEVILSDSLWEQAKERLGRGFSVEPLGHQVLAGISAPVLLYRLHHDALPRPGVTGPRLPALPTFLTPLVGRGEVVETAVRIVVEQLARLVVLVGPGGIGKTRVAVAAAKEAAAHFSDGVYYADLSEVGAPQALPSALLRAFGLPCLPTTEPIEQLRTYLAGRQALLVVDNFEHLLEGRQHFVDLLGASPGLRCLVTSRVALRVTGERVLAIPPLEVPEPGMALERLQQVPSVALFCLLARLRVPGWELSPKNSRAVTELCQRVGGIPLALELAAAKLDVLSVEEIVSQLEQGLEVLAAPEWQLPARQRALAATVKWSYEYLSPSGQKALRHATVFRGGFTWPAFEATAPVEEPLTALGELCSASLVSRQEKMGTSRFLVLGPVQDLIRREMEREEAAAASLRHALYFTRFAEERAAAAHTARETEAFEELDEERDNLLAAAEWLVAERREAELAARMVLTLCDYLSRRGLWVVRERLLRGAHDLALRQGAASSAQWWPRLVYELASCLHDAGKVTEAKPLAAEALESARARGQADIEARCLNLLGLLAEDAGEMELAWQTFMQALQLWEQIGDLRGEGVAHSNLGTLALARQELERARQELEVALAAWRRAGDAAGECLALNNLGVVSEKCGLIDEAEARYRDAAALYLRVGDRLGLAVAVNNLGEIAAHRGDLPRAVMLISAAERALDDIGSPLSSVCAQTLAELALRCPAKQFRDAAEAGRNTPPGELVV